MSGRLVLTLSKDNSNFEKRKKIKGDHAYEHYGDRYRDYEHKYDTHG